NWAHAHGGGLSVDRPRAPHPSRPYPGRARQVRSYVLDTFADVWPFRVTESVQCSGLRSRPPGPVRHGSRTGPGGPAERHAARSPPCATTVTTCCATPTALAGFWPVTSRPSTTTHGSKLGALTCVAPRSSNRVCKRNGTTWVSPTA